VPVRAPIQPSDSVVHDTEPTAAGSLDTLHQRGNIFHRV